MIRRFARNHSFESFEFFKYSILFASFSPLKTKKFNFWTISRILMLSAQTTLYICIPIAKSFSLNLLFVFSNSFSQFFYWNTVSHCFFSQFFFRVNRYLQIFCNGGYTIATNLSLLLFISFLNLIFNYFHLCDI